MPQTPAKISIPTPLPSPLPDSLRATLQSQIVASNAVPSIRSTLESACAASDWETSLRNRVLEILREGEVESKSQLVQQIVREARGRGGDGGQNPASGKEGAEKGKEESNEKVTDIRIPERGIREATKIVRGVLEERVDIWPEEREKDFWA